MKLRDFIADLNSEICQTILSEIETFEKTGKVAEDSALRRAANEFSIKSGTPDSTTMTFMFIGSEVWRRLAYDALPPKAWQASLQTAPKKIPSGYALMAILPGFDHPEAVHWETYPEDVAEKLGQDGYWNYDSENISELTGGIESKEAEKALWTLLDLPNSI